MLRVRSLSKHFKASGGTVRAVDGLGFTISPGAFVAIVGKSGSGKSTLLSMLGALDRPSAGSIDLAGQELTQLDDASLNDYRRESVGFVFQSYLLVPNLTALANVMLPMEYAGVGWSKRRTRARELLALVGLDEAKQKRRPGRLSGGEQQRVAIARALANGPRLILADEPTGNLDKETGKKIVELLKQVARTQKAIVVAATHDEQIMNVADRSFQITDGRLVKAFTMRDGTLVEEKNLQADPAMPAPPPKRGPPRPPGGAP